MKKVVDFVADRGYPIPYGDTTATVLVGHFAAQHNGAVITCDSAIRYNDKRIECFGSVLINKKETPFTATGPTTTVRSTRRGSMLRW